MSAKSSDAIGMAIITASAPQHVVKPNHKQFTPKLEIILSMALLYKADTGLNQGWIILKTSEIANKDPTSVHQPRNHTLHFQISPSAGNWYLRRVCFYWTGDVPCPIWPANMESQYHRPNNCRIVAFTILSLICRLLYNISISQVFRNYSTEKKYPSKSN